MAAFVTDEVATSVCAWCPCIPYKDANRKALLLTVGWALVLAECLQHLGYLLFAVRLYNYVHLH